MTEESSKRFEEAWKKALSDGVDFSWLLDSHYSASASLDPAIFVAIVSAGAASLSAILTYLATRKSGTIVIQGKDGTKVEVPEGTSREELNHFIELANNLSEPKVTSPKIEVMKIDELLTLRIALFLTYLATRKSGTIVIQGKDGTKVEVPKVISVEELIHFIELIENLSEPQIIEPKLEEDLIWLKDKNWEWLSELYIADNLRGYIDLTQEDKFPPAIVDKLLEGLRKVDKEHDENEESSNEEDRR